MTTQPTAGEGRLGPGQGSLWELVSAVCLALWFILPGVTGLAALLIRRIGPEDGGTVGGMVSIVFAVLLLVIGLLILLRRYFLALAYLVLDLVLTLAAGFSGPRSPEPRGENIAWTASAAMAMAGILWILERRLLSRRSVRWRRPVAMTLTAVFILNTPLLSKRLGDGMGMALSPPLVSRVAVAGDRLPKLRFAGEDGSFLYLDEPGAVYVVNFWATWCAPCILELPYLLEMVGKLPEEAPVHLLAVNTEGLRRPELQEFLKEKNLLDLAVYTDPDGNGNLLGAQTIPLTAIVQNHRLVAKHVGYRGSMIGELREEIESALAEARGQAEEEDPSLERPVP